MRITENPLAALDDAETQKQETWARGPPNLATLALVQCSHRIAQGGLIHPTWSG